VTRGPCCGSGPWGQWGWRGRQGLACWRATGRGRGGGAGGRGEGRDDRRPGRCVQKMSPPRQKLTTFRWCSGSRGESREGGGGLDAAVAVSQVAEGGAGQEADGGGGQFVL